jgi:hypothetical protein
MSRDARPPQVPARRIVSDSTTEFVLYEEPAGEAAKGSLGAGNPPPPSPEKRRRCPPPAASCVRFLRLRTKC